jgi:hypothetical protein
MATVASSPPRSPDKHTTLKKLISEVASWLEPTVVYSGRLMPTEPLIPVAAESLGDDSQALPVTS